MAPLAFIKQTARRLRRNDEGASLVEFAIALPTILLLFAVIVEGSRLFWSYQATVAGVRDAARYLGRSVQTDICNGTDTLAGWSSTLTSIVNETSSGSALFPTNINVIAVNATHECFTGDFRLAQTPIATVTAELRIEFPFEALFDLVGIKLFTTTTFVTDQTRIFGA